MGVGVVEGVGSDYEGAGLCLSKRCQRCFNLRLRPCAKYVKLQSELCCRVTHFLCDFLGARGIVRIDK